MIKISLYFRRIKEVRNMELIDEIKSHLPIPA